MKTIKAKELTGAEFLRNLVLWMNSRNEFLNDNKSILSLIAEYRKYLNTL